MGSKTRGEIEQVHHDAHGLNGRLIVECDARNAEGVSPDYKVKLDGALVGHVTFQNGPCDAKSSTPGMSDEAFVTIAIDRFQGHLNGPHAGDETREVFELLCRALGVMKKGANDRAAAGVLGTESKP